MIAIASEQELKSAFRPIDRDEVLVPAQLVFPIKLTDYIAWMEPSGHRVYLLFQEPDGSGARGLVFKRTHSSGSEPVMQMCQWCHSVRAGDAVRLLTVKADSRRTVGLHLCGDLSCKEKVLSIPGVNDLREPFGAYEKLFRVVMNMSDFARTIRPNEGKTLNPTSSKSIEFASEPNRKLH